MFLVGLTESLEYFCELRFVCEVFRFVRIFLCVVQFFCRSGTCHELFNSRGKFSFCLQFSHFLYHGAFFVVGYVLVVRFIGEVVLDVVVAFVAYASYHIVSFVDAIPSGVYVFSRFGYIRTKERLGLHVFGYRQGCQVHDCRAQIDQADEVVADGTRLALAGQAVFFRYAGDHRYV